MLFRRNDRFWEARIGDLKEAHAQEVRALNKVIEALAEQIEYLRATFGRPHLPSAKGTPGLSWPPPELLDLVSDDEGGNDLPRQYLNEDEEDLIALRENGLISDEELAAVQATLRLQ